MKDLQLPLKLKNSLQDFIRAVADTYKEELVSVILYGSAASGEFIDAHSNINVLVVLKDADLKVLERSAKLVRRFTALSPLFFSESYILASLDIFPIEFLDMKENYRVLYGNDVFKEIRIDTRNLRFQCEQELKARLINLKQLYLRIHRDKTALRNALFNSFTSVLHIARNILRLKGKLPPYVKQDIIKEVALILPIDSPSWEKILAARNKQIRLQRRDIDTAFTGFVRDLEKIVDYVDRL